MSSILSAELSATCNALGTYDKKLGKYFIDEFTLNTVKDLIRYLRRDGEDHEIRRHFGQTKVLQTDLLPMLIDHWENPELFDVTLRLIVNLTNPALLLYREEVPTERSERHNYLQILAHLQAYKEESFTRIEIWNVFAKKLGKILEIDWSERDEDTGLIIERILIIIRNVLHVPADLDKERRPENDASVHDQVLWALNQSGILDIILYMSSENEKQYFMHILEIISHLLREQNPTSLADAALQRSVEEKLRDEQELLNIRQMENKQKINKIRQLSASRHSRFGGTYVIQNMKSLSDNEMITLKPLNKLSNLDFSGSKKTKLVKPTNKRPVDSGNLERRSAFAIRLFLKEFCIEFLNSSYNLLMHYVKDVLVRARAQQNDESYYLWAVKFFMEFNRGHNFQVGLVSETMSIPMFHYVQQQMEKYFDMIKVEKKKFVLWVRRLHLALRAYKELLNTLLAMDKSTDTTVRESAKVIKSNIFYVLEYREFILTTFLNYDENKMPRSYLVDLVETVHLFLKMLEHFCKKTGLVVQKKVRKKTKSKKVKPKAQKSKPSEPAVGSTAWDEVRPQIAAVMSAGVDELPPPFDAASDVPIDQQKEDCMKKIQRLMREYQYEEAVGMFRAAREVWPEEGIFGVSGIEDHEELEMLETIYKTDLGVAANEASNANDVNETQENSEYDDEEDQEEDDNAAAIIETDFDFQDFILRFCHPRVISACVYLLEGYEKNLPHTNHCAVKMLHRIAWDCHRPSMMFQASLFLIFQKLFNNSTPQHKELEKFGLFVVRKFTEIASKNPKVFIELLFWKNSKDAAEIEHGYDLYIDQKDKPGKGAWSLEEEEELRALYFENQRNPQTDQDVIDWILENLINQTRTRRGVIAKLKELGLIFKAPTKRSNRDISGKIPKHFTDEEDQMLRELWNEYSSTSDPMTMIMVRMPRKRSKRSFIDRMLELNVIQDKKECRKKKERKNKRKGVDGDSGGTASDSSATSESDSDKSDSGSDAKNTTVARRKKTFKKVHQENKRNKESLVELSVNEIARLLVKCVEEGLTEALKWLAESLEEEALDQEAEGYDPSSEATPLVPISKECKDAMTDALFVKLLKGVGIVPPRDEQESYWRIPSTLHYETLRKRKEVILRAVNKDLIIDTNEINETDHYHVAKSIENTNNASSDDDDLFDNLRKLREIDSPPSETASTSLSNQKRSRSEASDASRSSESEILMKSINISENNRRKSHNVNAHKNVRKILDTDESSSDVNESSEDTLVKLRKNRKRARSQSRDGNGRRKKLQKILELDESDDDNDVNSEVNHISDTEANTSPKKNNQIDNEIKNNMEVQQNDDEDDILLFAKKTLQHDLPDTEDILGMISNKDTATSDDSDDEDIVVSKRRRRLVIDDDSE